MGTERYEVKVKMLHRPTMDNLIEIQKAIQGKLKGQVYSLELDMRKWRSAPLEMVVDECVWVFQLDDPNDFDVFAKSLRIIPGIQDVERLHGLGGKWPKKNKSTEQEERRGEGA